jgi:hypothetical protein
MQEFSKMEELMNKYLKKIAESLGLDLKKLTYAKLKKP